VLYKQVVFSLRFADNAAAKLVRKNRRQKDLLSMRVNEIKIMQSSWKLDPNDIEIQEKIGQGTFCVVHRAVMNKTWIVALKRYKSQGGKRNSLGSLEANSQEIKFLMRTRHRRLVMFVGFGICGDGTKDMFVVMEYLSGGDLSSRIWRSSTSSNNGNYPSWSHRIRWITDIAEGLTYLHYIHKAVRVCVIFTYRRPFLFYTQT